MLNIYVNYGHRKNI